jgi:PfaD family protein
MSTVADPLVPIASRALPVDQPILEYTLGSDGVIGFSNFEAYISQPRIPLHVIADAETEAVGVGIGGWVSRHPPTSRGYRFLGTLPPLHPEWLGDRSFLTAHKLRFAMAAGEMATGIATPEMVVAAAEAGFLGFFGAGGLSLDRVERAITVIGSRLDVDDKSWGINLIHSPYDAALEEALVDIYLKRGVKRISASAFMTLSPAIVRFAVSGLSVNASGAIVRERFVFAKVSRTEVAKQFLSPPPQQMLAQLVAARKITAEEARLASMVPVAEDITVEADSGGHTDNRPLVSLLPVILAQRDALVRQFGYERSVRVGAAGGLGTPSAVAAAFSLGAAYVMTGSVNQSAVEAGTSTAVKEMLAQAQVADVAMAPAADMFELGVKVQVLKRGTMFASRATALYQAYQEYPSFESIPQKTSKLIEQQILRATFQQVWSQCVEFWTRRDPSQVARAEKDAKHRMALVFRWYLGNASKWAMSGTPERRMDYQIWCGPAMGAFNAWVMDSFLAEPRNRTVAQIGLNLLEGAAVVTRAQQLRSYGAAVAQSAFDYRPRAIC